MSDGRAYAHLPLQRPQPELYRWSPRGHLSHRTTKPPPNPPQSLYPTSGSGTHLAGKAACGVVSTQTFGTWIGWGDLREEEPDYSLTHPYSLYINHPANSSVMHQGRLQGASCETTLGKQPECQLNE